ncbi:type IV pilus biogenesis protein PilM [Oceanobacillus massiliensis]|uniref:type IV pilus biogenesis protein PilM n=1 Tax=Oceanobacillus massiliensis TaxID=1465765 RepID=UPI000288A15D|nr:pilus assembly protein PilM [Oceanobacillus massiliensis]
MGLMKSGRVNIVITNHVLRYSYHKNNTVAGMTVHGEVELPEGTIKDGNIENDGVFVEIVNQLVHVHKWKRKRLFFAMPDDTVVIRQLQIPAALAMEETVGYIKTQIGNSLYLPFPDPVIAIESIDADDKYRDILLFAYPEDKIKGFKAAFETAGLRPMAADLTSLSIYRYYYQTKPKDRNHVLLIHWNKDAIVLTAFRNHKAIFTRYMKITVDKETDEEQVQQLINQYMIEINRIIDFYHYSITKGEGKVEQLLLTGDSPFLGMVKSSLSSLIPLPIDGLEQEELPAKYMDVLGLALKNDS